MSHRHFLLFLPLTLLAASPCLSQDKPPAKDPSQAKVKTQVVENSEPAPVKLEDLFKQADVVAVLKILSGDTEHYSATVYKTEVVKPFKGVAAGQIVFLGPFVGYRIGWEYVAFLRRTDEKMAPSKEPTSPGTTYGPLPSFYHIMYQGYSIMEGSYECVFDGKEISEKCDYGIKINTYQVILPKKIKTFPAPPEEGESSDSKWVRKKPFLEYLDTLRFNR
ncbi:MAG: hypothetical protein WAM91_02020 [Candidatus Acidiferrales bacterium]